MKKMRLHDLLERMPGSAYVHIEDAYDKVLLRGRACDALKYLKDGEVFTFFSMSDLEYESILYISLED